MTIRDFLIVGSGIAGASAAYELAQYGSVTVLEREARPDIHASGRSTATFVETYGNRAVSALTLASRSFYESPPGGFAEHALLSPRGCLYLARDDQLADLDRLEAESRASGAVTERLDAGAVRERVPALRPGYAAAGLLEAGADDIDVNAVHQGYLRGLAARGGQIVLDAEVASLSRTGGAWRVETPAGPFAGNVLVNAAGAWADEVAARAGLAPLGLVPKRRTVIVVDPPDGLACGGWPLVHDVAENFYFKPEGSRLLVTPADETPSPPCDAQPEEFDVALAAARLEEVTTIEVRRITRKWAGLRTFAADNKPVVGPDPAEPSFLWLAGQGGFGFQTAPVLSQALACLAVDAETPESFAEFGIDADAFLIRDSI